MQEKTYSQLMVDGKNYIELKLELKEAAELHDLVRSFTAIASQFDDYIKSEHPNLVDETTKIYVKEIRKGSIIADLVPFIQPMIQNMDSALVVDGFIRRYGSILKTYASGQISEDAKKSDVQDFNGQVAAIANDPDGKIQLSSAEFHQTKNTTRVSFQFDTSEAKLIEKTAQDHIKQIEAKAYEVHNNVLLVFWQSNLKDAKKGKRSGEKAIIEAISQKELAVIYDSELAEEKIKHETKDGDRNIYKLGFYVTCRVERLNSRPVAYRISAVHSIIELPD